MPSREELRNHITYTQARATGAWVENNHCPYCGSRLHTEASDLVAHWHCHCGFHLTEAK